MRFLFLPEHPNREFYAILALFQELDYTAARSPDEPFDVAMLWQDATWVTPPPLLTEIARHKPVLNLRCTDISKLKVEAVHREVFGYGSLVDPTRHRGRCIVKSDENAATWGELIEAPVEAPRDGAVYQVYIDTEQDGVQIEYRTPVVLGAIPEIKLWRREPLRLDRRLNQRRWLSTTSCLVAEIYTPEEQERLLEFSRRMGLDLGELDVLRSPEDGRLYVLDVNKTPSDYGLRNRVQWPPGHRKPSIARLAACLDSRLQALVGAEGPAGGKPEPGTAAAGPA